MPAYSEEKRKYHLERVRAVMILRPNATPREIQTVLEQSIEAPLHLDDEYIAKLMKKIIEERRRRLELANLNLRIATIQDKKRLIDERLWREATNPNNPPVARIVALRELFKNELELLQAEMDAGVFTRHLGEIEHRPAPLTDAEKAKILSVFLKWGLIKPKNPDEAKNLPAQGLKLPTQNGESTKN
jgi:hypothetical protein